MFVALFKKKTADGESKSGDDAAFVPQPEKARQWFDHAKTAAMSSNHAYALKCFADGIKLDPGAMSAHEGMWEAAVSYMQKGGKPATGKELREVDDGTPVGRLAAAEFEWMKDVRNPKSGLKALDAAVKADQLEFGHWIAPKVLAQVKRQKKLTKNVLIQAMNLFRQVGAWDESMEAGEMARQLDPRDNDLANDLKNLSAQRAMDQGRYDQAAGQEGGFRMSIRDADRQRALVEEEEIGAGATVEERNLARARTAYEATPNVPDVLNRYAQLLKKQGTEEAVTAAGDVYDKGYRDTGEYRFRMQAGDIRIELLERQLGEVESQLSNDSGNAAMRSRRDALKQELLDLKASEYAERVTKYPTDRFRKFDLGTVLFEKGERQEAMAQFQNAKDEPKLRVRAGHLLGRCFLDEKWFGEAVAEFEEALQSLDATEQDRELMIKYDLMLALIESAREESSIDLAKQAKTICSEIARKNITYRDIRAKRNEVDELIKGIEG